MRRVHLYLILFLIFGNSSSVWAKVNVIYQPESGYLRVAGQLTIEPQPGPLTLVVFPEAHITEFWIEGLTDYHLEREEKAILVSFALETDTQIALLELSYEGFITFETDYITLDRNTLWFPEFSFPVQTPTFVLELSPHWGLQVPNEQTREITRDSTVTNWDSPENDYPWFSVYLGEEQPTADTNHVFVEESPLVEEFVSRLQIQVARLTNLLTARNSEGLTTLITEELNMQGLPAYLAAMPRNYGEISSQFLSTPTGIEEPFDIVFTTENGPRFLATMAWQDDGGTMLLRHFTLLPYSPALPEEINQSLQHFVQTVQNAIKLEDLASLDKLLNEPREKTSQFLRTLNVRVPWMIKYATLEPLTVTVLIAQTPQTQLLLNLSLSAKDHGWLIDACSVFPLR